MEWKAQPGEQMICPDDARLQYAGRVDFTDAKNPVFLFTASYVRFRMTGKHLRVVLTNAHHLWENRLGVVVNGEQFGVLLDWDKVCDIDLSEHLRDGENEVMLFKRQDSCCELTLHAIFLAEDAQLLAPPARPTRRIEFYGDSVSAGEVTEAVEYAGRLDPENHQARFNNVWYSYAWQTARLLDAEISDIAQGGIALQDGRGYFFDTGMLSCWDKIAYNPVLREVKDWDFSRFTPHVVVVAIGQNDSAPVNYMHEDYHGELAQKWRADYRRFISMIREKYPQAHILMTTTIMCHSPEWDDAIEEVYRDLSQTDARVHHFLYSNNGTGTPGHVRATEAAVMAKELADYIDAIPGVWQEAEQ